MHTHINRVIWIMLAWSMVLLNASTLNESLKADDINLLLTTDKALIVGSNQISIELSKDSKPITDLEILQMKIFMPEMPGMPYMEYKADAKLVDGKYLIDVNFAMSGTWQYKIRFKTSDKKKYKTKSSINL